MKPAVLKSMKIFILLVGLVLFFGQKVSGQGNECEQLSLNDIVARFTLRDSKSVELINENLVKEIRRKKVIFTPTAAEEKKLRKTGADESVIRTIRENLRPVSKESILIYQKYIDHYQSRDIEKLKIALNAAKEFVEKFEKDTCYKEQIEYFKAAIPTLEATIKNAGVIHPYPHPYPRNSKYNLLSQLEKQYRAKNWNEVFSLGEKVLEIDPEFTPLIIVLAGVGFEQAKLKGEKSEFNDETVRYAELAIKLLEAEKETSNRYGALDYEYKTKAEALAKMNEILDFMKSRNLSESKVKD